MQLTTEHVLSLLQPALGQTLVNRTTQRALLELAKRLPFNLASGYIECRIASGEGSQVDLLTALDASQRQASARRLECSDYQSGLAGLMGLMSHWGDRGSPLHDVPTIWLEFDDVVNQAQPRASVCVCCAPEYANPFASLATDRSPELSSMMSLAVEVMRRAKPDASEQDYLRRCVDGLPDRAHWIHLSVMSERPTRELKLYGRFPRAELSRYLTRVGWKGDTTELERVIGRYSGPGRAHEFLYVDLPLNALSDRANAGLGICFSQQQVWQSGGADNRREALLTTLVDDGLCCAAQAAELSQWPGQTSIGATWAWVRGQIERWLDIKLVLHSSCPLRAKAYLGFSTWPSERSSQLK